MTLKELSNLPELKQWGEPFEETWAGGVFTKIGSDGKVPDGPKTAVWVGNEPRVEAARSKLEALGYAVIVNEPSKVSRWWKITFEVQE